jgi:hypothetical protein
MQFNIVTSSNDGDIRELATVDWPAIPRKGDNLRLTGLVKRKDDTKDEKKRLAARSEEHEFVVLDVDWAARIDDRADAHRAQRNTEVEITVFVAPTHPVWDETEYGE